MRPKNWHDTSLAVSNVQQMIILRDCSLIYQHGVYIVQMSNLILFSGFAAVSSQSFSSPFVSDNNFDNVFGQNNYGQS